MGPLATSEQTIGFGPKANVLLDVATAYEAHIAVDRSYPILVKSLIQLVSQVFPLSGE